MLNVPVTWVEGELVGLLVGLLLIGLALAPPHVFFVVAALLLSAAALYVGLDSPAVFILLLAIGVASATLSVYLMRRRLREFRVERRVSAAEVRRRLQRPPEHPPALHSQRGGTTPTAP